MSLPFTTILIFVLTSGGTYGGVAISQVEFRNMELCQISKADIDAQKRSYVITYCVQVK